MYIFLALSQIHASKVHSTNACSRITNTGEFERSEVYFDAIVVLLAISSHFSGDSAIHWRYLVFTKGQKISSPCSIEPQ